MVDLKAGRDAWSPCRTPCSSFVSAVILTVSMFSRLRGSRDKKDVALQRGFQVITDEKCKSEI